ncbi:hypothetical protein [Psychromonas aquimarina]|uniref:hypothetical protein n=1 Tax=Psychromonas aquimarina TaxID=444919 RepID=UPI0003F603B6|nr:hypothetical protein [Psychromonas aquimarina]
MPLEVGIGKDEKSLEFKLVFKPEAFYWVLTPEIDHLNSVTGKYIDLYSEVKFRPVESVHLRKLINDVKERIATKPDYWQECVGKQTFPEEKEIYKKVSKYKFLEFIYELELIVKESEDQNLIVVFDGD